MIAILENIYENVEWYVILLGWITVPLGFLTLLLFFHNHYGLFDRFKTPEK